MDIAITAERILTGFAEGHAELSETLTALRACCDDVPLPNRDNFFKHLLLRHYREALAARKYRRLIPIIHAWAAFGPADVLPVYLYSMRGFEHDDVQCWVREVLPIFRQTLGDYAERFSDATIETVDSDCQTLKNAEPLFGQLPFSADIIKSIDALRETARYIKHKRLLRTIAKPQSEQKPKEYDDLLPLCRRRVLDEDLQRELRAATDEMPLTLAMLDLDWFKKINDTHGHQTGDEVLLRCAEIVSRVTKGKGIAYRYGGEEFAVLLPNCTIEEGVAVCERVRTSIASTVLTNAKIPVTVSIGIATAPTHAKDVRRLIEAADSAMYQAKNLGRNRVRVSGAGEFRN